MKIRKNAVIWGLMLAIPMLMLAIAMILSPKGNPASSGTTSSISPVITSSDSDFSESASREYYTIKTTESGNVGVYKGSESKPSIVLHEIVLMALPKLDREKLKDGITVYSNEELYALIEDLDS